MRIPRIPKGRLSKVKVTNPLYAKIHGVNVGDTVIIDTRRSSIKVRKTK